MQPKWGRRKEARPLEIVDAAVDVFLENGFAAAKLSDIAKRARVAKGTIYLYFETKEELFRAAARQLISTNLEGLETAQATFDGSIEELIPTLLQRAVSSGGDARLSAALRMVLSESRMFPELARIWHDEVASRMIRLVASAVERAQAKGTVRSKRLKSHGLFNHGSDRNGCAVPRAVRDLESACTCAGQTCVPACFNDPSWHHCGCDVSRPHGVVKG